MIEYSVHSKKDGWHFIIWNGKKQIVYKSHLSYGNYVDCSVAARHFVMDKYGPYNNYIARGNL
jgi:hypothetical protein